MDLSSERVATPSPSLPARAVATVPKDAADVLVEFSVALHKRAMYPIGHPHLTESTARFIARIEAHLATRGQLAIGVAGRQLILAGVATEPRNALLSDLARRLHRHRIATLRFERGVGDEEIDGLLAALIEDPSAERGALGLRTDASTAWPHLRIQAPDLNRLLLLEDDAETHDVRESPEDALWIGLANLALSGDGTPASEANDPLNVARAIEGQTDDPGYDRVVFDYLGQIAEELTSHRDGAETLVRERVSELVTSLRPATLRRILQGGEGNAERRRLALTGADAFALDAVLELLEAAATTTGQTISHQLLRLLHKLAHHAEQGRPEVSAEAESALRRNVESLIAGWELEDPNPDSYTAVLESIVQHAPSAPELDPDALAHEPELVLQVGLEIGCAGPRVVAAIEALVGTGRLGRAVELLRDARPAESTDALWRQVANPAFLRAELSSTRFDFDTIESLALRLGAQAADPLLDVLEHSTDRATRARTLRILVALGPEVASAVTARLKDSPWYVQRNLLAVLRQLRIWPEGFSAVPYARHPDARLRQEAFRLLLEFPAHRGSAIVRGVGDSDATIAALVLRAALDECPPDALPALERYALDRRQPADLRAIAVRAFAQAAGPKAVPRLLALAGVRRRFFRWRLGAKSPVVVAAIAELARLGDEGPLAVRVLDMARRHVDPEIRLAAGPVPA